MQRVTEPVLRDRLAPQRQASKRVGLRGWAPVVLLPLAVCALRSRVAPWEFMWLLSIAIFLGCKWQTWFFAAGRDRASVGRSLGYLFLWPGMDADEFLVGPAPQKPRSTDWLVAFAKAAAGAVLIVLAAKNLGSVSPLLAGWLGMLGLVLMLHFGTFNLLALLWQTVGVNAQPIMRSPLASTSLGEFWGKRWNIGFRELSHGLIFQPLRRRLGLVPAMLAAFLASGLIHDFVISFPARGGYGLPTAYFVLQGIGVQVERSSIGRWIGAGRGVRGWLFVALFAGGPAFFLFHPTFVTRVIVPFLAAMRSTLGFR
ncbi:MAG TPA: membrane bound O-acyl transferase family-domain-containing protein [Candidatus Limnocylindrales bacterium]|nr:membrane bound O-acyl transferase family-domain-containing protein [Candidatus Limnocylindrales bacterium]